MVKQPKLKEVDFTTWDGDFTDLTNQIADWNS